ncbi:hypothetical protein C4572_02150 [Candidatus Parcubacteria bacterium]|nr:MAG: hypothetical protein C4572_02150 [Candidatus Parcubacteria bacterium]
MAIKWLLSAALIVLFLFFTGRILRHFSSETEKLFECRYLKNGQSVISKIRARSKRQALAELRRKKVSVLSIKQVG